MSRRSRRRRPDRTLPLVESPHYVYIYIYIFFFSSSFLSFLRDDSTALARYGRRSASFFEPSAPRTSHTKLSVLQGNCGCGCGCGGGSGGSDGDDAREPTVSVALLTVLGRSCDCYATRGCTCASVLCFGIYACGTPIGGHSSRRGQSERPMHLPPAPAAASRFLFLPLARDDPPFSACAFTLFTVA